MPQKSAWKHTIQTSIEFIENKLLSFLATESAPDEFRKNSEMFLTVSVSSTLCGPYPSLTCCTRLLTYLPRGLERQHAYSHANRRHTAIQHWTVCEEYQPPNPRGRVQFEFTKAQ